MVVVVAKSTRAAVVAVSLWAHIKCGVCSEWFVVEDSKERQFYCCHCGVLNDCHREEDDVAGPKVPTNQPAECVAD